MNPLTQIVVTLSRLPLVLTRDSDDVPTITVTNVHPDDGPLGSVTFDTPTDKARGALFLVSQNGNDAETIPDADILAAINAVL